MLILCSADCIEKNGANSDLWEICRILGIAFRRLIRHSKDYQYTEFSTGSSTGLVNAIGPKSVSTSQDGLGPSPKAYTFSCYKSVLPSSASLLKVDYFGKFHPVARVRSLIRVRC